MTTLLYFQNLSWITNKSWRFANALSVPKNVSDERWAQAYNDFYGYSRTTEEKVNPPVVQPKGTGRAKVWLLQKRDTK